MRVVRPDPDPGSTHQQSGGERDRADPAVGQPDRSRRGSCDGGVVAGERPVAEGGTGLHRHDVQRPAGPLFMEGGLEQVVDEVRGHHDQRGAQGHGGPRGIRGPRAPPGREHQQGEQGQAVVRPDADG